MRDFIMSLWNSLFGKKQDTPEGVVQMHRALFELQQSTDSLKKTLDEHRDEYVAAEPIREHIVPNQYTRRQQGI